MPAERPNGRQIIEEAKRLIAEIHPDTDIDDVDRWRHHAVTLLADSDDPLTREIATQLRDGQMSLRDLCRVSEYREYLFGGVAEVTDVAAVFEAAVASLRPDDSSEPATDQADDGVGDEGGDTDSMESIVMERGRFAAFG